MHLSSAAAGIDACQKRRKYMKRNPEMRPRTGTWVIHFIRLSSAAADMAPWHACETGLLHMKRTALFFHTHTKKSFF